MGLSFNLFRSYFVHGLVVDVVQNGRLITEFKTAKIKFWPNFDPVFVL